MARKKQTLIYSIIGAILIAIFMAFSGGSASQKIEQIPIFALLVAIAFLINWIAYIPAMLAQTEHYYDLIGAFTYISLVGVGFYLSGNHDARSYIASFMVIFWAVRLGSYLFLRVKRNGKDGRFDEMKGKPLNFFVAWTIQALWTVMTAACALVIITSEHRVDISWLGIFGIVVWCFGITIEIVADFQKSQFKNKPENKGKFISHGLWAWSQHPNYFGEIVLWTGMAIFSIPVMSSMQWFCVLSPVFVFVLLRYVSGVNLSHEIGDERWGQDPKYIKYRNTTPNLVLKPPVY